MADVSITIRKNTGGSDTTIMVTGQINDTDLDPITTQLTQLLYTSANTASTVTPAPAAV